MVLLQYGYGFFAIYVPYTVAYIFATVPKSYRFIENVYRLLLTGCLCLISFIYFILYFFQAITETQLIKDAELNSAVLSVYIDSCKKLPVSNKNRNFNMLIT